MSLPLVSMMILIVIHASSASNGNPPADLGESENSPYIAVNRLTPGPVEVMENAPIETFLAHIQVIGFDTGPDDIITCTTDSHTFSLKALFPNEYMLLTFQDLDYEQQTHYDVMIQCENGDSNLQILTTSIPVEIRDFNDNRPVFRENIYRVNIEENNAIDTPLITVSAIDYDTGINGEVRYALGGDASDFLNIDEYTGEIRTKVVFDYEVVQELRVELSVFDQGTPQQSSQATLLVQIVDVTENPPEFPVSHFEMRCYENRQPPEYVDRAYASDGNGDFRNLKFTLDTDGPFSIDDDGRIWTTEMLDRELQAVYEFTVTVLDTSNSMNATATVTVNIMDLNDNAPVIEFPSEENFHVAISRDSPAWTVVTSVLASDADAGENAELFYSIVYSTGGDLFLIDRQGRVPLARALSASDVQTYQVFIKVRDYWRLESFTRLAITVIN